MARKKTGPSGRSQSGPGTPHTLRNVKKWQADHYLEIRKVEAQCLASDNKAKVWTVFWSSVATVGVAWLGSPKEGSYPPLAIVLITAFGVSTAFLAFITFSLSRRNKRLVEALGECRKKYERVLDERRSTSGLTPQGDSPNP